MKAYWIAHVDVTDPDQYSHYTQRAPAAFALFGGRMLARAEVIIVEGVAP
jgi:uncharacterized protein (DUF1330 family)